MLQLNDSQHALLTWGRVCLLCSVLACVLTSARAQDTARTTRANVHKQRCGVKDMEFGVSLSDSRDQGSRQKQHRVKRYRYSTFGDGVKSRWAYSRITWRITRPTRQLPENTQREIMRRSLAKWQRVTPLTFVEAGPREVPDIDIRFVRGRHGPSEDPVFDGPEAPGTEDVLAHAWGPGYEGSESPLGGDLHFDDDNDWHNETHLENVAVHELGHSLGLLHSRDETAIMYPVYRNTAELGPDDIAGIRALYNGWRPKERGTSSGGQRTTRPRSRGRTRAPVSTIPPPRIKDPCMFFHIDTIIRETTLPSRMEYLAISGDKVHMISSYGMVIETKPFGHFFPQAPSDPDVIFSVPQAHSAYVIKGQQIWRYMNNDLVRGFPKSLRGARFPETPRYAVSTDQRGTSQVYLYGKSIFWLFDAETLKISGAAEISKYSRAMPHDVSYAIHWSDDKVYAVSAGSYAILDRTGRLTRHASVRGKPRWLHPLCEAKTDYNSASAIHLSASLAVLVNYSLLALWSRWIHL